MPIKINDDALSLKEGEDIELNGEYLHVGKNMLPITAITFIQYNRSETDEWKYVIYCVNSGNVPCFYLTESQGDKLKRLLINKNR